MLTARSLFSAEAPEEERWALLSDTHIAADPATLTRGVNMTEHLQAAVVAVGALSPLPVNVLVNGDCALDHGLPGDYAQFVKLLEPLREKGLTVHCALGNHDDREVFWTALPREAAAPRPVAGKHLSVLETPLANWFMLDSLEVTKQTPGRLGEEQRHWLAEALDARPTKPALVMVHHNPLLQPVEKPTGLLDSAELLEVLAPRRQVKALLYGHTHTWRVGQHEGIHLINLPAVAYNFAPDEVTGWVDARLRRDGVKLEVRAHDPEHPRNGAVQELSWRG